MSLRSLRSLLGIILFAFTITLAGCGSPDGNQRTGVDGAWLGKGTFASSHGSIEVKAQLELLSDGRYRFLILKPRILSLAGVELGTWQQTGQQIKLRPTANQTGSGAGVLANMPKTFRTKILTTTPEYSSLDLDDGPMSIHFEPNPKATEKLRASGDIR